VADFQHPFGSFELDSELLSQLTPQGFELTLAPVDLASGELPASRHVFAGGPLCDQHAAS
jgi:hypothetical protein